MVIYIWMVVASAGSLAAPIQAQVSDTSHLPLQVVPQSYKGSTETPWLVTSGSQLVVEIDSLYLVNTPRYLFYKRLHDYVRLDSSAAQIYLELVNNYKESADIQKRAIDSLLHINRKSDSLFSNTLSSTSATLVTIDQKLKVAQDSLAHTNVKLEGVKKDIRKMRFEKFIYGAGGIALGLLTGLLLTNK